MGHENEYQGTGTKWCCFLYVIVYIVAPFLPVRSHFEAGAYISNEYKAVDCLRTNKNNVHTGTRSPLSCPSTRSWLPAPFPNSNLGT